MAPKSLSPFYTLYWTLLPPTVCERPAAVTRYLRTHKLLTVHDKVLPRPVPDGGRMDDAPTLAAAWIVQCAAQTARIPWTVVPVSLGPAHPSRWVAACHTQTPDGQTAWVFYPPWPRSDASAEACRHRLASLLPPSVEIGGTAPPDVIRQARAAWRRPFQPLAPPAPAPLTPRPPAPRL